MLKVKSLGSRALGHRTHCFLMHKPWCSPMHLRTCKVGPHISFHHLIMQTSFFHHYPALTVNATCELPSHRSMQRPIQSIRLRKGKAPIPRPVSLPQDNPLHQPLVTLPGPLCAQPAPFVFRYEDLQRLPGWSCLHGYSCRTRACLGADATRSPKPSSCLFPAPFMTPLSQGQSSLPSPHNSPPDTWTAPRGGRAAPQSRLLQAPLTQIWMLTKASPSFPKFCLPPQPLHLKVPPPDVYPSGHL